MLDCLPTLKFLGGQGMFFRHVHARIFIFILSVIAFLAVSGVAYAQALIVIITPPSGPPGTIFTISTSGGGFEGYPVECTVNGVSVGTFDYYGVYYNYQVPLGAAPGAVYTIYCFQPSVPDSGPLAGTAYFTVTAADSDGDGIPDGQDSCPFDFAQTPNGCPDSDGDGISDGQDSCPFEFGQTPNGCPDSDGDGIPNGQDSCPFEFAQTANGCPPPTVTPLPSSTPLPTATIPVATQPPPPPTAIPVTPTVSSFVRPAAVDFSQFADCIDLRQQAVGISITEMIRISVTDNPCASLTDALRRQRFGSVNLPSPLSQPRSAELRCSTDPRSVPSADFMWLDSNYARFGSQIRLNWAGVSDAELCAAQAGDPFRLAATRGILAPLDRAEYYTGVCYGILTGAQMREAMARLRAGADREVATLMISSLSSSSRLVGRSVWCWYLQRRILNISQADIDQQNTLLNRLVECRVIQNAEIDIWRARINEGQAGFTWNDLAAYFGYLGSRCMSNIDFMMFIANRGVFLNAQTVIQLPVATVAPVQQLFEFGSAPGIIELLGPLQTRTQTTEIARCPTDTRTLPTPEMQTLLGLINRLTNGLFDPSRPASGAPGLLPDDGATSLALFLSTLNESGICAIMRGDPFALVSSMSAPTNELRYRLWTTTCLGGSYPDANYADSVMQLRVMNDPRTAGVISAVDAASTSAEKTSLWCAHVNALMGDIPPLPISAEQQASLDYLGNCLNLTRLQIAILYEVLMGSSNAAGLPIPGALLNVGITFEDFISIIDVWRAANPSRCPTQDDLIAQIEQLANNRLVTEISATAAVLQNNIAIGIVHEVICDRQSVTYLALGRTPQGCIARGGGTYLEANTRRDSFEAGIPGVEVTIYRGVCSYPGSNVLVGTTTTNADGYFELGGLQAVPHCLSIDLDSGPNPTALGEGMWWTPMGVGGTHFWFTFTPTSTAPGSIAVIPSFGWWPASQSGVTTRMGSGEEMLYAADTIIATYDPGLWP
ncbi:hypothetical protein FBR02_19160, partial [Anaerolineae bacterium CFX9]|nr:hypothetical protein [Anaerolineae bacterium CFX9]